MSALKRRRDVVLGAAASLSCGMLSRFATAQELETFTIGGHAVQGGLVLVRAPAGSQAWVEKSSVRISDGLFCFGFSRDADKPISFQVEYPDGRREVKSLSAEKRKFDIQRVDGLDQNYVTPPKEVLERIARDAKAVGEARTHSSDIKAFATEFDWPAKGPITSVFGSQRILNGVPAEPHYGVDIAAPEGSPVTAPAEGTITLAEDLYLSGNTIILEHGQGVSTSYLHMSRLDVKVGDFVGRGQQIGLIGHTGRATGPHVCWRLNWLQTRLDAELVAGPRPAIKT